MQRTLRKARNRMPKLSTLWKDIEENAGGGFSDIEPGMYELVVTECTAHPDNKGYNGEPKPYFELAWDVASGERKGIYATSQYPPTTRLYWSDKALGFLKHRLHVLADWNPGFKSTVAFETDQWSQFVGKHFGAVVRKRLFTAGPNSKNPGADRYSMEVAAWLSPDDFKAQNFNRSLLEDNDQRSNKDSQPAAQQDAASVPDTFDSGTSADVYDEDIPF